MTKKLQGKNKAKQNAFPSSEFNKRVGEENYGVDRKPVLSSGRKLPSSHGWNDLALHCDIAYRAKEKAERELAEAEPHILTAMAKLQEKYRRDKSRLREDPQAYTLKQKLKVLHQRVLSNVELYNELQRRYKQSTGTHWKPRPDINKPLDLENEKDNQRAKISPKASLRKTTKLR